MKRLILLTTLSLVFAMGAIAQEKTADVKKLLEVMNSEKMIDDMVESMIPIMKQQASAQIKGDNAQVKFDEYVEFMMQEVKELSNKLINEEMASIYDKHFTHQEIKDLIKFYESPLGKKLLEKTPAITSDLMASMSSKYMPAFQDRLKAKMIELMQ